MENKLTLLFYFKPSKAQFHSEQNSFDLSFTLSQKLNLSKTDFLFCA